METINHEYYVSLEVAKLLKQAGFDWECNHHFCLEIFSENEVPYRNHNSGVDAYGHDNRGQYMSAPTLDVAQRWLRENFKKDIHPILADENIPLWYVEVIDISIDNSWGKRELPSIKTSFSYEEALEAGIKKCLTLILEKDGNMGDKL